MPRLIRMKPHLGRIMLLGVEITEEMKVVMVDTPYNMTLSDCLWRGGGGAGDANSTTGGVIQGGNGGRGGGIVYLQLYGTISGTAVIEANGAPGQNANPNNQNRRIWEQLEITVMMVQVAQVAQE